MREEVQRIIKMVQDGKLSAEDAAELIDAFSSSGGDSGAGHDGHETPPPPPPPKPPKGVDEIKDPFKAFVESMEKLGKDASESVNWQDIAAQVRQGTKKGVEAIRQGLEEVSKGKVNFAWLGTHESKDVTLPISLAAGKVLRIENPCGDVKVVGGFDHGTVNAHARFRGATVEDAKAKADAYTLIIEESDHLVLIKQPDVTGLSVDLEVQLSGGGTVEIRCESGDISVMDTAGGCRVTGKSGDIRLKGLNGLIEVNSASGDVSVEDSVTPSLSLENKSGDISLKAIEGNVNVRSASGDVSAVRCKTKTMAVESVSGDVRVDLTEPITGNVSVRTVNGDADLAVVDGSDCLVKLSTLSGGVQCDLALEDASRGGQRVTGRLGAGSGSLDVSAISGNISLKLHDAVAVD